MTTQLYSLEDRIITDDGRVVAKPGLLLRELVRGRDVSEILTIRTEDSDRFVELTGTRLNYWSDDGIVTGPDESAWNWTIPEPFISLDLFSYIKGLHDNLKHNDTRYEERFVQEYEAMLASEMEPFFRAIIYIMDVLNRHRVVRGVGRGSACASYLLMLIGVHRIDPVVYEIPMDEFFKNSLSDPA